MYPVPTAERSVHEHRHKRIAKPAAAQDYTTQRLFTEGMQRRLHDISTIERNPSHAILAHLSASGAPDHLEKRHVKQEIHQFQPSKKRTKEECFPLPDDYKARLFPVDGGLAESRPAVRWTAGLDYGASPHCVPQGDFLIRHRRNLEPLSGGNTKNILCLGVEPAPHKNTGRKFLTLPRDPSCAPHVPLGFQSNRFGMFCDTERPTGKLRLDQAPLYDPLRLRAHSSLN